jgi:protein TonB
MFDDLLESAKERKKTNKSWAVILSGSVQVIILGVLVLIPLIYTQALPKAMLATFIAAPPPPPPPPPPPQAVQKVEIKPVARLIQPGKLLQPRAIPKEVAVFKEDALGALPPDVVNNSQEGIFGGIAGANVIGVPAALAPPPPKPTGPTRIKQGGQVTQASQLVKTNPIYPALARQARIQGDVVLHAIIDKDGKVSELQVISGHPLLVQSAIDAVKQWRYKPTLLNGEAVEVDTTITVHFSMAG